MNRGAVLEWILQDAERNEDQYKEADGAQDGSHDALLRDLESLGETEPPASLPATPEEAIPLLRAHYGDKVTPIYRVLNHLFPKGYLFYRVSKLEEEVFRGFDFFSPVVPEFGFPFPRVGRTGFDRYLEVSATLLRLFGEAYPDLENPQARVSWFLYEGLGRLFTEKSDHNRYWVMATRPEHSVGLDSDGEVEWSGRKEMQEGDLVFMYRTLPRSAITDVLEVTGEPIFDPWGA